MQHPIKLESFSAVGPGSTANLVLATGLTYDAIYIETNLAPAEILGVKLELNAEEIFNLTGAELVMLDQFDEVEASFAGPTYRYNLPLQFESAVLADTQRTLSLALGPGDNCVLNVDIATGTTPVLSAFAETGADRGKRELVRKFERYTVPVAAAGTTEFFSMNKGSRVIRMHFDSDDMEGLEIVRDRLKLYELDKARNDFLLQRAGKTPQTGYFHFDPTKRGFPIIDSFSTQAQNLVFKLSMADGGNVPVLVERLYPMPYNWSQGAATSVPTRKRRAIGRG